MILGALSTLFRRKLISLRDDELRTLDRDGPRALNFMMSRGLKRIRTRFWAALRTLLFLVFATYYFEWTGAGLLAWVIFGAVVTVVIDLMRQILAGRWMLYSHSRLYRAEEVLIVASSVESGRTSRPAPRPRPEVLVTLAISAACTLIGLPIIWVTLSRLGIANWDTVFANFFLPLCMIVVAAVRLVRGFLGIQFAKGATVGSRDLCLDSDDVLDTYVAALLLSLLLIPFGATGPMLVAYAVTIGRLAWFGYQWWEQRKIAAVLQRRVYRIHPNATVSKAGWDDEHEAD